MGEWEGRGGGDVYFAFLSTSPSARLRRGSDRRRLAPLIPAAISIILAGALAPPYNIIIYAREGSLIRAPRGCKMADHVNAPLIFRDLARLPASKHLSGFSCRSLLKSTLLPPLR